MANTEVVKSYLFDAHRALSNGDAHDPHSLLGLHFCSIDGHNRLIRLFRPGAKEVHVELFGSIIKTQKGDEEGFFECQVPPHTTASDYKVYHQNGMLANDPYAYLPTISDYDCHLFSQGVHYNLYQKLGAHPCIHNNTAGVRFAVWAPAAKRVSLVGDFNYWNGRMNPMRSLGNSGIWELFVPGLNAGAKYKFEIKTQTDEILIKADPFAFSSELRPATASIVADTGQFPWSDQTWLKRRQEARQIQEPLLIYEVHLGSWKKENGHFMNYRRIAPLLAEHCKNLHFTHVELMPIQEHPLDESWGYQVSGFYAPTSRFGSPEDFQWFVNYLHQEGIGVILDWVPGHFPTDSFSLGRFDGTALYEHEDKRQGLHPHWNTYIFNFGRKEVTNFLVANALYWLNEMHVDGLRVDAVASMLYLDYGREVGEWIPNQYGRHENLEAIEFLRHLNSVVHQRAPGTLMIAEESTSFGGVSHPVDRGGLGFDLKWNMGWMNDTLRYFSVDMFFRHYHQNELTFGLLYAFSEHFMLVFSHDEVVHGKKSLLGKMPGDFWQQFANMRLLYSYMICQPGKKLLFMGGEIGQWNEWNCKGEIEWFLLNYPIHASLQRMIKDINQFYLEHPSLWMRDFDHTGFEWVDFQDRQNSVISYLRKSQNQYLLCVHNFTPIYHERYRLKLSHVNAMWEVFNTDAEAYGGSGKPSNINLLGGVIEISLAPLATQIFEVVFAV